MEVLPIDLTAVLGIIFGSTVVIIPLLGFTARYALKPLTESLGRLKQSRENEESVRILERRVALFEQQLEGMDTTMTRLADAAEFHRELRSGAAPASPGDPTGEPGPIRSPAASPHVPGERRR